MGKKVAIGTLVGFVALYLVGLALYGLILKGTMAKLYEAAGACIDTQSGMVYIILATLFQSILLAWLLYKFGNKSFGSGAISAGIVTLLVVLWYDMWFLGSFPFFTTSHMLWDVIANVLMGTLAGGAIGFVYGKVK